VAIRAFLMSFKGRTPCLAVGASSSYQWRMMKGSPVSFHCARALLPQGWAEDVLIEIGADGRFARVEPGAAPVSAAERLAIAVPGMANVHSHAFQRGMAGLAEIAGKGPGGGEDSFWTWREVMYRFLDQLTPDDVEAIAAELYAEMLEAGFTAVGEFHYLHHRPDGGPYDDPAEMSARIVAAAEATGIGLTHLPVFYAQGGFGGAPPGEGQRRFLHDIDGFARLMQTLDGRHPVTDRFRLGVAPHSLRAVRPDGLAAVVRLRPQGPIHIHVAEQEKEVDACITWSGKRPVRWLLEHQPVDERWCLIHCTHMDESEIRSLAGSRAVAGLCPVTEANLGDGIFRGTLYHAAEGRFAIGSDSHIRVDLADELRTLEYGQRLRDRRRNRLAQLGGSVGGGLFRSALAGGAAALGQPMGVIRPGMRGDLVALDADHPALIGKTGDTLLDAWLFAAGPSPVTRTIVAGATLVSNGRHHARDDLAPAYARTMRRLLA